MTGGPIRVLHFARVINRYDFIDNVIRGVDRSRFAMLAATLWARSNIEAPDYAAIGVPHAVIHGDRRWQYPWTLAGLVRILARERVDILHVHHYDEALLAALARAIRPRTKLVVGRHYSDALYRLDSAPKRRLLLAFERLVHARAARVVVPSTLIRDILVRQGVPESRLTVIPYGFDPERYRRPSAEELEGIRAELGLAGRFVVGCFGRLVEEKGQRHLVAAAERLRERLPDLLVLLVGDGPGRPALERAIEARGLRGHVTVTGWRRDALKVMAAVDVVAQPTYQEAFSQVMAEALWTARPLVITPVSGVGDVIRDGETGLVVPFRDEAALAEALLGLARDPERRLSLAARGRAFAEQTLDIRSVVPRHERVYAEVMDER